MAEVRLSPLRIGFPYSVDVTFPAGFLQPGESIRMKLRKYAGAPESYTFADERFGDSVTLTLTKEQTDLLSPGSYIGEAVIYTEPPTSETPLATNVYILDADYSPAE